MIEKISRRLNIPGKSPPKGPPPQAPPEPPKEGGEDRIIIEMNPGGPVELTDLTQSFAALARMYERHHRPRGVEDPAPKLYVARLRDGSIIAEIVLLTTFLGQAVPVMDTALIVSDFTRRLWRGIKAFSDINPVVVGELSTGKAEPPPSKEDAADLKTFVRPLTGKHGAALGIKHARFEQRDGKKHTVAEYVFDENELNRATINIEHALAEDVDLTSELSPEDQIQAQGGSLHKEVMLFFEQASRKPGKEMGRTGDRGIVPDVSSKPLPVYFRKSIQDLKDRMIRSEINPLTNHAFVVDVHVQMVNGKPKAYVVTDVHKAVDVGDDE